MTGNELKQIGVLGREYELIDGKISLKRNIATIDFSKTQHVNVLAPTGAGKSYTLAVYIEELAKNMDDNTVVVFDLNSDYWGLKRPNTDRESIYNWNTQVGKNEVTPRGYTNIETWIPKGEKHRFKPEEYDSVFSMKMKNFHSESLIYVFGLEEFTPMVNLFIDTEDRLIRRNVEYDIDDFIGEIFETKLDSKYKDSTVDGLIGRMKILKTLGLISADGFEIHEILKPNKVILFDLSRSNYVARNTIVHFIIHQILDRRSEIAPEAIRARCENKLIDRPGGYFGYVDLIIEETKAITDSAICTLAEQGRKYGVRLVTVCQNSEIPKTLMDNAQIKLIGPVSGDDLSVILKSTHLEVSAKEARLITKKLREGCWWYINTAEKISQLIRIRPRETFHPASTKRFRENMVYKDYTPASGSQLIQLIKESNGIPVLEIPKELRLFIPQLVEKQLLELIDKDGQSTVILTEG